MTGALIAVAAFIIGWFAAGSIVNVRKGHAALRWLEGGLPMLGERTTVRWLGTTAIDMRIAKAKPPVEQAAVVVFLEPRDLPWLWVLSRSRGRRDTLIVRARLRRAPAEELEILDHASWSGRDAQRRIGEKRWSVREAAVPGDLTVYYKFPRSLDTADALIGLARGGGLSVRRLALHPEDVHLELHVDLPASAAPAAEFFTAVRAIGERAGSV
ncbi:MAG: hypothetical protein LAO05_13055 [Acidobacteriia bacterium]|nr:hypothetical protein [Terriglobia bacterium]